MQKFVKELQKFAPKDTKGNPTGKLAKTNTGLLGYFVEDEKESQSIVWFSRPFFSLTEFVYMGTTNCSNTLSYEGW